MAALGALKTFVVTEDAELFSSDHYYPVQRIALVPTGAAGGDAGGRTRVISASAGQRHFAAVSEEGEVFTWGKNDYGALGTGAAASPMNAPVAHIPRMVFGDRPVVQLALGMEHSLALSVDGTVYTAGCGSEGQLGHGDRANVLLFTRVAALAAVRVEFVAAGLRMSAVTGGGGVFTCGHGPDGELGLGGNLDDRLLPTRLTTFGVAPTVLLRASRHVMAVQADGAMWAWGQNRFGQLGLGDVDNRVQPTVVPFQPVVTAACGLKHTLVVTKDRVVHSCGRGTLGPLAGGDASNGRVLVRAGGLPSAVSVSAGYNVSSAAVTAGGQLYTWEGWAGTGAHAPVLHALNARVGRFNHLLSEPFSVAVAMGVHTRLGELSPLHALPDCVLRRLLEACASWPAGPAGALEGLARLLGGGVFDTV